MKTRTLLLLSVVTALAILVAGGVLLLQLSSGDNEIDAAQLGERVDVGDARIVVFGATVDGEVLDVDVELGGVDDADGLDTFRLVTGDRTLAPIVAPGDGRCAEITVETQRCVIAFDVSAVDTSSRLLIVRRGDEQRSWAVGT
ncbi:MAG: hypothetical protein AAFY28_11910 [Actinomycetota bacterium]